MLWPLIFLGHVVLVTSRPFHLRDDVTWIRPSRGNQWPVRAYSDVSPPGSKRALAVLSRWRPLGSALQSWLRGRSPVAVPVSGALPELDFVSAETRGTIRPLGQPLRWGR